MLLDRGAQRGGRQLLRRFDRELAPDRAPPARSPPARRGRAGRAGRRGWAWIVGGTSSSPAHPSAHDQGHHLLDEERVALGRVSYAFPDGRVETTSSRQCVDHRPRPPPPRAARAGGRRRCACRPPGRSCVEQLGPRRGRGAGRARHGRGLRDGRGDRAVPASAQWMSSITSTSGCSSANDSTKTRIASAASSAETSVSSKPTRPASSSAASSSASSSPASPAARRSPVACSTISRSGRKVTPSP